VCVVFAYVCVWCVCARVGGVWCVFVYECVCVVCVCVYVCVVCVYVW